VSLLELLLEEEEKKKKGGKVKLIGVCGGVTISV
jgi:hypothetical protein